MVYLISLALLLILDAAWLSVMVGRFYKPHMQHLMGETINYTPAIIFYILYAFAITYLIVAQSDNKSLLQVFLNGAVFGLAAYATYNLTNAATLRDWPSILSLVDMSWGTILTGLVSLGTVWITRKF